MAGNIPATTDVLVIGAGPTGLLLAGELAAAGVRALLVERRDEQESNLTRAFAVQARTLELLDACGVADELVKTGQTIDHFRLFGHVDVNLSKLPSRFPYVLVTPQYQTERVLRDRAISAGVELFFGTEATALNQDEQGVVVDLSNSGRVDRCRASYVVGTDGVHSTVRRELNMPFLGHPSKVSWLILADIRLTETPPGVFTVNASGEDFAFLAPFGDGWYRIFVWNRSMHVPEGADVTLDPVREIARRILGTDFGMHDPRWISRFHNDERQVPQYRKGRVFLAGDAAHVHSPAGAQGMNAGLQDAANLGWKLAAVLRGLRSNALLDTYQSERHPVDASIVRMTEFLVSLVVLRNPLVRAVRSVIGAAAMRIGPIATAAANALSNLAVAYPRPAGAHPLVGKRAADVKLNTEPGSSRRLYEALRARQFVVVSSANDRPSVARLSKPWSQRIKHVTAPSGAKQTLMIVRPDGYIAWASDKHQSPQIDSALANALKHCCGPP